MAKLKVEIRETVTLSNNNKYDAYNRYTLDGINHVDKRIIRIPTTGQPVLSLSGSGVTQLYKEENVRYMRFTNLSTYHPVMLEFKNHDGDTFVTKVGEGLSFIYSGASGSGVMSTLDCESTSAIDIEGSGYAGLGDLVNVIAKASGSSTEYAGSTSGSVHNVDMEIFVAAV